MPALGWLNNLDFAGGGELTQALSVVGVGVPTLSLQTAHLITLSIVGVGVVTMSKQLTLSQTLAVVGVGVPTLAHELDVFPVESRGFRRLNPFR